MEHLYQRYKQSKLSRSAFCKGEGIRLAQFTYWCHRFEKEAILAPQTPPRIIATQATVSASLQAEAKQVEKSPVGSILAKGPSSFSQVQLPVGLVSEPPMPSPLILPTPLIVLDLPGKGSVSFYTQVEAGFIKALL